MLQNYRQKIKALKQSNEKQRIKHQLRNNEVISQLSSKFKTSEQKSVAASNLLRKVFSTSQIKLLKGHQGKVWWKEDEISRAIVLKAKSTSAYHLVRESWGIPLPGVSTLRRWTSKISFSPGILWPVIALLKEKFKNATAFSRQCVLCYDEMALEMD